MAHDHGNPPRPGMRRLILLLLLLTLVAQAVLLWSAGPDLAAVSAGEGLIVLSPALLGLGGAAVAHRLRRRSRVLAWVAAGLPLLLLGLFLLLAIFLWFNPIRHQP